MRNKNKLKILKEMVDHWILIAIIFENGGYLNTITDKLYSKDNNIITIINDSTYLLCKHYNNCVNCPIYMDAQCGSLDSSFPYKLFRDSPCSETAWNMATYLMNLYGYKKSEIEGQK